LNGTTTRIARSDVRHIGADLLDATHRLMTEDIPGVMSGPRTAKMEV